ncbi:hypothetical protein OPV22_007465 [Ensete ventricosum]|uniref:Threonine dehydratase n=1 Tax=Ensete ventricosum TaxID=4639 RepID=A0AAV8RRS0_ENSVE|nr:hypothetical protein OPV22_007465 [Ensete ventricosum]
MESHAVARRPLPPLPARAAAAAAPRTALSLQPFRPTSTGGGGRARRSPLVASAVTTQREAGATFTVATPPREGIGGLVAVRKRRSWGHHREDTAGRGGEVPERGAHPDSVPDQRALLEGLRRGDRVPAAAGTEAVGEARGKSLAQERGLATGILVQATRSLQYDGVALAAQKLHCDALIVMPVTTPEIKWRSVERLGATVVLKGDSYDEAQTYAKQRAEQEGRTFIHPFDHPDVITGQGTIGMEIVRQLTGPLHAIFVPVGGGGLIAGIAAYVKQVSPEVKIIGVEPSDANAMALSLYHGQRIMLEHVGGFADGVAVKVVGEETFRLCRELVDGVVLVRRDAICASIKDMFEEKRSILEPAGALSLAGAEAYCKYYGLKGANVVAITSGANMNFDRLRLVTELADVGRKREAVLATILPEEHGSFKAFCKLVGSMNITEFKYRYDSRREDALVLYSVGLHTDTELGAMVNRMKSAQLRTIDLTNDDLAKDHLRYFMGGRSTVQDELLCRFIFPERPGALMKFLDAFSPRWNISLFHYRAQGETGANVLVGIQVPKEDMREFKRRAQDLGYEYTYEMTDESYRLLMQVIRKQDYTVSTHECIRSWKSHRPSVLVRISKPQISGLLSHCLRKLPIHVTHQPKVRNLIGGELVESQSKDWIDVINPDMFEEKRSILESARALSL